MHSAVVIPFLTLLYTVSSVQASSVWTVNCGVLTIQRSDPILSVGVASSHVHAVVGGTAFSRNMSDPNAAVNANATTCDKYTDHSNYVCSTPTMRKPLLIRPSGALNSTI